jgi:hypothetical protein
LTHLVFIELHAAAACFQDAWHHAEAFDPDEADEAAPAEGEQPGEARGKKSLAGRHLDLALAAGYMLKTQAGGWRLFCERLNVSPFLVWEALPGFDRLRRSLDLAERAAFTPAGFLAWLNATRPEGESERAEIGLTAERLAGAAAEMFKSRLILWSG